MVACNLDLKPAYKVTPASQERHHTNETFAWYRSRERRLFHLFVHHCSLAL